MHLLIDFLDETEKVNEEEIVGENENR